MRAKFRSAVAGGYKAYNPGAIAARRAEVRDIPPRESPQLENGINRVLAYYLRYPHHKREDAAIALGLSIHTVSKCRSHLIDVGQLDRLPRRSRLRG